MTRNIATVHSAPFRSIVEPIKQNDIVNAAIVRMPSIPAGGNPFHYDSSSMGTTLSRNWMVMHSGNFGDHGHDEMYLVNTVTGQRIGLNFEAKEDRFTESVWCGNKDLDEGELYLWTRDYDQVNFHTLVDHLRATWGSKPSGFGFGRSYKTSPIYVYIGMHFVRVEVVLDAEAFARWCDVNELSVDDSHPAVIAARRWEAAQLIVAGTNDSTPNFVIDRAAVEKRLDLRQNADFTDTSVLESKHGDKGVHVRVIGEGDINA